MAPEMDPRMFLQQCAYTVHGSPTPLDEPGRADASLRRITITPRARNDIRGALDLMQISHATLFPDLEHLARTLSTQQYQAPRVE